MDEEIARRQSQLEQATRHELPADEPLDAETAELRAGWVALSRLLETADNGFAEQTLLAHLRESPPQAWRHWVGVGVLAASLLVAVAAGWLWLRAGRSPDSPTSGEVAELRQPANSRTPAANGEFRWDDSWDERLAQLDQKFVSLRSWASPGEVSLRVMDEQLQQIDREMNAEL